MKKLLYALGAAICLMGCTTGQDLSVIDVKNRLQTHEGWGVSLCWWANVCGAWQNEAALDSMLNLLASPEYLNYNIFRYNIGGGDDPLWRNCEPHHCGLPGGKGLRAEMPGFKDFSDDEYHWDRDSAQRRVLLKLRDARPDALFEAFSNSAPYYLTRSGCIGGAVEPTDDNVPEENYEEFARYLVDVCKMYKDVYNIEFLTLEPFNEPVCDWWRAGGSQEGCHFGTEGQIEFLRILAPMLKESGLRTMISAADESRVWQSVIDFNAYKESDCLSCIGQWNTHTYDGTNEQKAELHELVRTEGLRLWMSETGKGGKGFHDNLTFAQRIIDDLRYLQPDAWCDWQFVEEHGDQWCMLNSDWYEDDDFRINKNYYVHYQFTHFISPGYTFIRTDNEGLLAAISPDKKELVIIALNTSEEVAAPYTINFKGFRATGATACRTTSTENNTPTTDFILRPHILGFVLPPLSIATFVLAK